MDGQQNIKPMCNSFFIIRTVSGESLEKTETHILLWNIFFFAVYKMMVKNMVIAERPQTKIWRVRIACWISKATDTQSEYGIFNAFPLQQWL